MSERQLPESDRIYILFYHFCLLNYINGRNKHVPRLVRESPLALDGQSFRVLVWDHNLVDMWYMDHDGRRRAFRGRGSQWHCHPDTELTVITRGSGVLAVGDHIGRFQAPDCLLLAGHVPHVWTSRDETAGISLQFRIDDATGIGTLPECQALQPVWKRAQHGLRLQGTTADTLRDQLTGLTRGSALRRLGLAIGVLDTLRSAKSRDVRQLSTTPLLIEDVAPARNGMERVVAYLMEHSSDDVRLATAVRLSGRSQATFCRQFVKLTGRTFVSYLTALRLQEVQRALLETDRRVTDIAFSAGFTGLPHFYTVFRRATGCNPLAFRRNGSRIGK